MTTTPETVEELIEELEHEMLVHNETRKKLRPASTDSCQCLYCKRFNAIIYHLRALQAERRVTGETSDGYHTFNELYDHRCLLFLAWVTSDGCPGKTYRILDHFEGWDLIVTHCYDKQVSYHVPVKFRRLAGSIRLAKNDEHQFDGHTSADVLKRIEEWIVPPPWTGE